MSVQVVTVDSADVEVPDACPDCKADLTADDALTECGWMAVEQTGDDYRDFPECQMVTGYKCAACGELLAGES